MSVSYTILFPSQVLGNSMPLDNKILSSQKESIFIQPEGQKTLNFDHVKSVFFPEVNRFFQPSKAYVHRCKAVKTQQDVTQEKKRLLENEGAIELEYQYPETKEEWLERAALFVSDINPPLTMILDLDETLLSLGKAYGRFNEEFVTQNGRLTFYYDYKALREVAAIQSKGHKILVMTHATYSYSEIKFLFYTVGIELKQAEYFNAPYFKGFDTAKADFLDDAGFKHESMLFDDQKYNKPNDCHFYLISKGEPFPTLEK
ncbi:hypothetical protein D5R81_01480 [Parashewanella spongiae]|uniref:Uncharacterized protein n=1 Tax=Parashewanella spongiae TaxID=342950 RepID=A0A3A6U5K4_9GAMM|nr:hypothetical protein [Parashewanella spongiae]MCL1076782.1 hypothetical protein [Parashewanella spongiae]RJY19293.1 hypothetical protein D5R81_01480 [Parashewanella spongiae]